MPKRLWVLPILAILAIGVVAAACGGGNGGSTATATRTPAASPTARRPAVSPTPAATATPARTATPAATAAPAATATPAGGATEITVIAAAMAFNTNSIEVTAGQPFTITVENQDTVPHNLNIYTQQGGTSIAVTDPQLIPAGGTGTLITTIAQPGTYYFQCDFHPTQMNGTLTAK